MSENNLYVIGDPGRAATQVRPGAPTIYPDSADYEITECEVPGARILGASLRGIMHRAQRKPRQDRFSVIYDDPTATLVVTVCDGVGEFELSQDAAAYVAVNAPAAYLRSRDWNAAVAEVNAGLVEFAGSAAQRPGLFGAQPEPRMATTLAAVAIRFADGPRVASIAWTGDTSVWRLSKEGWELLTRNEEKEAAVDSGRVRALPHQDPRVMVVDREVPDGALFVATDGVGKPLQDAGQVQEALAEWWASPPDVFTFARQVNFARRTHTDDRTAVGVWFGPS